MEASVASRRRSAHAAAIAAKQRRQRILLVGLLVVVVVVLAYEAPGLIHRVRGTSSSGSSVPTAVNSTPSRPRTLPKAFRRSEAADPFVTRSLSNGDSQVTASSAGRDPFAAPGSAAASRPAVANPLPEQIVIGRPTGRGSIHGWIVILASIPTDNGRASAVSFANEARRNGVDNVLVLNSSNRRPLRGGYWVVYSGPVSSLAAVNALAGRVHGRGYGSAYIRELLVYR
jgi:hypothetical protein